MGVQFLQWGHANGMPTCSKDLGRRMMRMDPSKPTLKKIHDPRKTNLKYRGLWILNIRHGKMMQDAVILPHQLDPPILPILKPICCRISWLCGLCGSCSRPLGQFNLRIHLRGQFFNGNLSGKRIRWEKQILQSILRVEVCQTAGKGYGFVYS